MAEVVGVDNLYAYGKTEMEARKELISVIEMMLDFHTEQVNREKEIRDFMLSQSQKEYAV
ncbi:MAG: hypothetical protein H6767_03025 [Candidatus Peribacteria bacterium]|nr:MAG: hypothetical protein H6767_03025 [Candidatus Peribacteria bacterium]